MLKRCVSITREFDLAIGEVNLDKKVYLLKELRYSLMLRILDNIPGAYDDLILERLIQTRI